MKIAIATPVYYPMINGVAMFSYNLARGLAARGNEVVVITPSHTCKKHVELEDGVKVQYLKSFDVKVYPDQIHDVPKKKLVYKHGLKAAAFPNRQIKKILDDFKPDVVHVQGSDPVGVVTVKYAKKHQIPVVATEHNQPEVLTESLHMPGMMRKPVNNMLSNYFRKRQLKSDYAIMPTQLAIDKLTAGKDVGVPIEAVSNGVDLSAFKPGKARKDIYNIYSIPEGVPTILYIGRVDPEKQVDVVLKAFAQFLDKHKLDKLSKTLFVVAGDGVALSSLKSEAKRLGIVDSVRFLGRVTAPDLYEVYKMGDVFVTASQIETQGIVLIEAAATGLPLIAVNGGAVAEVCQNNVNGILLNPGDKEGMIEAISKLLSDDKLRAKMSEASLKIAKDHSLEHTIDKFLEIYNKLCYNK